MQIKHICEISNGQVWLDGELLLDAEDGTFLSFIHNVYRTQNINYPKFFKMDPLCKLAVLGSSLILDKIPNPGNRDIALVFANKSSSSDIDLKHQESIADKANYFPSPANFVYTLPNIAIGEVSIKYGLKTESAFFLFDSFNKPFLCGYSAALLQQNRADLVLCGWIEVLKDTYQGIFFIVSQEDADEQLLLQLENRIKTNK